MSISVLRRRPRLLIGVAATGLVAATLAIVPINPTAATSGAGASPYDVPLAVDVNPDPHVLETTLVAQEVDGVDIGNGQTADLMTFNGSIPGPELRLAAGDMLIVHFRNDMAHPTGIHWHGIELPNKVDGTPLTQNLVEPGDSYLYKFEVPRAGVYWYHPHHHSSTNQVFKGMYGSLIVTEAAEATLQAENVLPPAENTHTMVLGDITVCQDGPDPANLFDPSLPHASGGPLPAQFGPGPDDICDAPVDEHGHPIEDDGDDVDGNGTPVPLAGGEVPNIQELSGPVNEGAIVLTNGKDVGGRAGDQNAPGALAGGASVLPVQPGSGHRFQVINAAAVRNFRLRMTDSTGAMIPLHRVGGEGGLLDEAILDGGHAPYEWLYDAGEIVLGPGDRADIVAAFPDTATGVATLWTLDFQRAGGGSGSPWARIPTVPVGHFEMTGAAVAPAYTIAPGTDLLTHPSVGGGVEVLGAASGGYAPVPAGKLGMENPDICLTAFGSGSATSINSVQGQHDFAGIDYTVIPKIESTRYAAEIGDTLELTVRNATPAQHPFHPHGFSIQPITLETRPTPPDSSQPCDPPIPTPGTVLHTFAPEFIDTINIPGNSVLRFRVRLDDRPLMDGTTPGGGTGRWVFHCHIFFHAVYGMISEFIVVDSTGNERPYVDAVDAATPEVAAGDPISMSGTFSDVDGDAVTLEASSGSVADNGDGTWTWTGNADSSVPFVYITATDAGGKKDQAAFSAPTANEPPEITVDEAAVTVDEGDTATNSGTASDPDGDALTYSASTGTVTDNGDGTWSWSFDTTDGPDETQTVTVTASDGDLEDSTTFDLTVDNVAPSVAITSPPDGSLYLIGSTVTITASIADPGADDLSCTYDWDDGLGAGAPVAAAAGTCSDTQTITAAGVYTVAVTGYDSDGAASPPAYVLIVVYDPDGPFITGGGTIVSPAGAYPADPTLTGKATFGFVSKYQKGASVPKGNTQFDFKAADFRFSSTEYQWLVVSGPKAQYKGTGTINGEGSYGFLLTARDGQATGGDGIDRFRLKVWDPVTDTVIYDNVLGGADDMDDADPQAVDSGSIVIHK